MRKRTKIITTLGPASSSPKIIKNLIEEGTDVFRINLSHSNIEEIRKIINTLKRASALLKRPVATLIDLQGQKIRIKGFANEKFIKLTPNSEFILDATLGNHKGSEKSVGITYKDLSNKRSDFNASGDDAFQASYVDDVTKNQANCFKLD